VAGCLLVLARERGVAFDEGISMLICSDVPEGGWGLEGVTLRVWGGAWGCREGGNSS